MINDRRLDAREIEITSLIIVETGYNNARGVPAFKRRRKFEPQLNSQQDSTNSRHDS